MLRHHVFRWKSVGFSENPTPTQLPLRSFSRMTGREGLLYRPTEAAVFKATTKQIGCLRRLVDGVEMACMKKVERTVECRNGFAIVAVLGQDRSEVDC